MEGGSSANLRSFLVRKQEKDFIQPDALVLQDLWRMAAQEDLLSLLTLYAREDLRQTSNDLRVQGELGLFENERP